MGGNNKVNWTLSAPVNLQRGKCGRGVITALDVTVQAQILELLCDLSETSKTALMLITLDLGVVAETCTRMITCTRAG